MSLVEFEKHKVVKSFMEACDVYYTNLGGYHYSKDRSPCYYLNGMLTMFEEQQKNIDLLEKEIVETQEFLNKQNHIKQAKIDELQKLRSLDEMEINQLAQANQVWQIKCDELQARIDKVVHILTYTNHASTPLCNELRDILKGNKDEN